MSIQIILNLVAVIGVCIFMVQSISESARLEFCQLEFSFVARTGLFWNVKEVQ